MHRSKIVLLIIAVALGGKLRAQEPINSISVEAKGYQLYQDKNWDELISFSNQALGDGYDYFYLRVRLGVAYFENKQFRIAAMHLQKALDLNSSDEFTQEYLYYAMMSSDRYDEARRLSKIFGPDLAKKLNVANWSPVDFAYGEGGAKISSRSDLFNPALYSQVGLKHSIGNRFSVLHAGTFYYQSEKRGTISQLQYFIQPSIPLGNQWTLTPSLHIVGLTFKKNGGLLKSTDLIGSLSITKAWSHAEISVGGTVSDVLTSLQYIQQSGVTCYPFGKPNFSFGAITYIHSEDNFKSSTLAASPFIYWRPSGNFRLYASYFVNKNENVVEMNGYLVNNSPDLTLSRWSTTASFSIGRSWDLYGTYQFENKQQSGTINYSYNNFYFGIKFKPQ